MSFWSDMEKHYISTHEFVSRDNLPRIEISKDIEMKICTSLYESIDLQFRPKLSGTIRVSVSLDEHPDYDYSYNSKNKCRIVLNDGAQNIIDEELSGGATSTVFKSINVEAGKIYTLRHSNTVAILNAAVYVPNKATLNYSVAEKIPKNLIYIE